jgi:adenylate kinase
VIIVILGPPGAGKGSQGTLLVEHYGLQYYASGDLLRWHVENKTKTGLEAVAYLEKGQLVPDAMISEIMVGVILDHTTSSESDEPESPVGVLLDGFPRTVAQAEILDEELAKKNKKVDLVLNLQVESQILEKRIVGRRTCPKCHRVYHLEQRPSKREGVCDDDGTSLFQRSDDTHDVALKRIDSYNETHEPLIAYYAACGNIAHVDGNNDFDEITAELTRLIDAVLNA